MSFRSIHIIGGGTVSHVRNHLAICTPAYGGTARQLQCLVEENLHTKRLSTSEKPDVELHLTRMAGGNAGETNEDIGILVDTLVKSIDTHVVFFNVALCDWSGDILTKMPPPLAGKYAPRLQTRFGRQRMNLLPQEKLLSRFRAQRKDVFLVAFKTTCGATEDEQFVAGLELLKTNSCNLVLANDTFTRTNMVITPEQSRYNVTTDRSQALKILVEMALSRSQGTFTRSVIVDGKSIDWNSLDVPEALRAVVNHCVSRGAYPLFNGKSVGHFAFKAAPETFYTSKRKTDFSQLDNTGLVKIESSGSDSVIAYGARPSVGGMSQRIIFSEHPQYDSIIHFHCERKPNSNVPRATQWENECGSHQCGQNTSSNLRQVGPGISCVYLDNHGPNIVFNSSVTKPQEVIDFIEANFDLTLSTSGLR